jgi:hypothetical protein
MQNQKIISLVALGLGLSLFATGCISTEETVYRDVDRVKVDFENEAAGRIFYEAFSKSSPHAERQESKTDISIPVVFEHKRRVVRSNNAEFNDAVARCDTNRDSKITETEARIFADQIPPKSK